jgi:large subunit ribosomal protein L23
VSRKRASNLLRGPYAVLRRPVLTEKSHSLLPEKQETGHEDRARYIFEVHPKADKTDIKRAIEAAFDVKVVSVNTLLVKPRRKAFRVPGQGGEGFTRQRKRAFVRLAKGKTIEMV